MCIPVISLVHGWNIYNQDMTFLLVYKDKTNPKSDSLLIYKPFLQINKSRFMDKYGMKVNLWHCAHGTMPTFMCCHCLPAMFKWTWAWTWGLTKRVERLPVWTLQDCWVSTCCKDINTIATNMDTLTQTRRSSPCSSSFIDSLKLHFYFLGLLLHFPSDLKTEYKQMVFIQ